MICHKCGSDKITHYRQVRSDGVSVVTARCENGHIPEKGKPFYSIALFEIDKLPLLNKDSDATQPALFERPITDNIDEFYSLDPIEQRRQIIARHNLRFPKVKNANS